MKPKRMISIAMNMAEVTLNLDFDIKTGPLNWKVITRFDKEAQTDYLDDLEERHQLRIWS